MLILQLLSFLNANIGNLGSKIPPYVNYRQVISQGLWNSHVVKSNGKRVLLSLKFSLKCLILFASLQWREKKIFKAKYIIAFMDVSDGISLSSYPQE